MKRLTSAWLQLEPTTELTGEIHLCQDQVQSLSSGLPALKRPLQAPKQQTCADSADILICSTKNYD
jgi:hypothetical protein